MEKTTVKGIDLYYNYVDKFTTSTFGMILQTKNELEYVKADVLLKPLILKRCKTYPTEFLFTEHLRDLYSATLGGAKDSIGNVFYTQINSTFINDEFVLDKTNIFKEIVKIYSEILHEPVFFQNNQFDEEMIQKEKKLIYENIDSINSDDTLTALYNIIDKLYRDDNERMKYCHDKKVIESITNEDLLNAYKKLQNSKKAFYYIGKYPLDKVKKIIEENYEDDNFSSFTPNYSSNPYYSNREVLKTFVSKENRQSLLFLIYKNHHDSFLDQNNVNEIFNKLLVSRTSSDLFQEVREKNNLCYFITSLPLNWNRTFIIYSGVNLDKIDDATKIIEDIIKNYQNNQFLPHHEKELEEAKQELICQHLSKFDSSAAYINKVMYKIFKNQDYELKDEIEKINKITLKDVSDYAKNFELDQIYVVKGVGKDDF